MKKQRTIVIISEYKLPDSKIKEYKLKGYRFYYGYEKMYIPKDARVGFLLKNMYPSTINRIETLLHFGHPVQLKYGDIEEELLIKEDWKHTHQSDKDQLKSVTESSEIRKIYLEKRKTYIQETKDKQHLVQYNFWLSPIEELDAIKLPRIPDNEEELDNFLKQTAPRYDIYVDYNDKVSKAQAWYQTQYYLQQNFEYSNPVPVTDPGSAGLDDNQFISENWNGLEVISFGDMNYLEDYAYKMTIN